MKPTARSELYLLPAAGPRQRGQVIDDISELGEPWYLLQNSAVSSESLSVHMTPPHSREPRVQT